MSHHIYHTKAYVIDSVEAGEANKKLSLLTEDLGLIYVAAQGIRHGKSKLAASVQDLSFSRISVVKGKEVWRLTNAEKLISLYDRRLPVLLRRHLASLLQLVKRLTPADVHIPEIFTLMKNHATFCFEQKDRAVKHTDELHLLFTIQLLKALGYGTSDEPTATVSEIGPITDEQFAHVLEHRAELTKIADTALRHSHL